jgi:hypothetical protein
MQDEKIYRKHERIRISLVTLWNELKSLKGNFDTPAVPVFSEFGPVFT